MKMLFHPSAKSLAAVAGVSALAFPAFGAPLRYTVPAAAGNSLLGSSIVALGDLDGDGVPDFAVGDPGYTAAGFSASGQVLILSGTDGSVLHTLLGTPAANQAFGRALAALDANGDGVTDLAVGATGAAGAVWIHSGVDGSLLQAITAASPGAGSRFGAALVNAGDQNGDGKEDLFAGAPGAATDSGAVLVLSGADGALLRSIAADLPGIEFGAALAALPDRNADGLTDLAVGAPAFSSGLGRVQILAGSDGTALATLPGSVPAARLGATLGALDDRNSDTVIDLLAGTGGGGGAFLLSGSDLATLSDLSLAGAAADQPVVPGGVIDVDLNGSIEFLIGYPGASPLPRVDVIPAPPAPEPNVYEAAAAGSGLGSAIAVIPGLGFALGEPLATGGGAVHVYAVLVDSDGDGVPDIDDLCPDSILDPTVIFGDLDTGVENRVNAEGCSLADLFAALEPASGWKNHGQFVSSSVKLVKRLLRAGDINATEAQALRTGAAQSNVGKSGKPTKPEKPEKPEKPTKPEKPEKPGKPEKPEKPEKPAKPDKPNKPNRP